MAEPVTANDLVDVLRKILDSKAVDVLGTRALLARYDAQQAAKECTGVAAVWCPRCGDCTCSDREELASTPDDKCPLHGLTSTHAEPQQTEASKPASEPKQLKIWQYDLPSIKGEGWAKVIIREDGFFSAVSDWGNFAFIWGSTGEVDVRKFFLRMERDWDYFARKFENGRRERVSNDKSVYAFKRALLKARRVREVSRENAAQDWENLQQHGDDWEGIIREAWNFDSEPWRFAVLETSDAVWFVKKVGPRLVEAIRKQLTEESAAATARSEPSKPALSEVEQIAALRRVNFELVTAALEIELISLRLALCGCERRIRAAFELKWANRAIHEEVDRRATLRASIRERDCNLKAVRALVNELERIDVIKPALSEVEKAALNVLAAFNGCGEGDYDSHSLPDAVFTLRDVLRKRGAL